MGRVRYAEGLFIGYRHYEQTGTAPLYAFGHGLSYTSFELSDLAVTRHPEGARVCFSITNTGARTGSTVAQVYVGDIESSVPRPKRELKGFRKVLLERGESTLVEIELSLRAFAWFDATVRGWRVEAGAFSVSVGFSAVDLVAQTELIMEAAILDI